jgi:hypothetical protein
MWDWEKRHFIHSISQSRVLLAYPLGSPGSAWIRPWWDSGGRKRGPQAAGTRAGEIVSLDAHAQADLDPVQEELPDGVGR